MVTRRSKRSAAAAEHGDNDEEESEAKRQRTLDEEQLEETEGNQENATAVLAAVAPVSVSPPQQQQKQLPLLPPEIWAEIMTDRVPYQDVMNFSATCRFFLHDVLPLVQRLFFSHAKELRVAQARRFKNVRQIKIYSYITPERYIDEHSGEERFCQKVDRDTALRVVPIHVYTMERGLTTNKYARKNDDAFRRWTHHKDSKSDRVEKSTSDDELHRTLVRNFCGAFDSGLLPKDLVVEGLIGNWDCLYAGEAGSCGGLCREAHRSFPLRGLFYLTTSPRVVDIQTCLSPSERLEMIASRPGGLSCLKCSTRAFDLVYFDDKRVMCTTLRMKLRRFAF